jgi:DNA-binding transcriptional LysR family regulator
MKATMEHRQLLNFLSICEQKSFSKATEQRFISQPALSKSIKQLEEQLDVPLFYRSSSGIELTEFGRALQLSAKSYINQHDQIVDTIKQLKEKTKQHLSIGITTGFHDALPSNFFKTFILDYPDISLNITSFSDDNCQEAMLEHKIALGFSCTPINTTLFDSIYSERSKLLLIAGKEHRLAQSHSVKLKELRGETVISFNNHMYPHSIITDLCAQHGFKPDILLSGAETNFVHELCGTNQIVSFWAGSVDKFPGLVSIDIEDIDLYFEFHLIVNKNTYISDAAKQFIDYTKEQLGTSHFFSQKEK